LLFPDGLRNQAIALKTLPGVNERNGDITTVVADCQHANTPRWDVTKITDMKRLARQPSLSFIKM
jgi:hypothetical protein